MVAVIGEDGWKFGKSMAGLHTATSVVLGSKANIGQNGRMQGLKRRTSFVPGQKS